MNVKKIIKKCKAQGKHIVKFQVSGMEEKIDVTKQLKKLNYCYNVYSEYGYSPDITPYYIIVEI